MTPLPRPRPYERRYPFHPLQRALSQVLGDDGIPIGDRLKSLAGFLGIHCRQAARWRSDGLTLGQLEGLCQRAHLHPYDLWPELVDELAELAITRRRERQAQWIRERRRSDPVADEANRQRSAAYREANADYVRLRERRRYWADPEAARRRKRDARQRDPELRAREQARSRAYYRANRTRLQAAERDRKAARRQLVVEGQPA